MLAITSTMCIWSTTTRVAVLRTLLEYMVQHVASMHPDCQTPTFLGQTDAKTNAFLGPKKRQGRSPDRGLAHADPRLAWLLDNIQQKIQTTCMPSVTNGLRSFAKPADVCVCFETIERGAGESRERGKGNTRQKEAHLSRGCARIAPLHETLR